MGHFGTLGRSSGPTCNRASHAIDEGDIGIEIERAADTHTSSRAVVGSSIVSG